MSRARGSVCRRRIPATHRRCRGIEDQKHRVAATIEDMPTVFAGVEGQSEDIRVETFGGCEVVGVKRRLQDREGHARDCTGSNRRYLHLDEKRQT